MSTGPAARGPLAPLAGTPGLTGALVRSTLLALAQVLGVVTLAAGLAAAVADTVAGASPARGVAVAAAGLALRVAAGFLADLQISRDARRGEDELREQVLARLLDGEGEAVEATGGTGPAAVLAGTRLHELAPALATVIPALATTIVVPPVVLLALGLTDWVSALVVAVTLPLVPLFMALVGMHTRDATAAATRALDRIADHVAELVRGLPVLVGLGRAADQLASLDRLGRAHRTRTLATLRVAFLSALVLEVLATLAVALVAVFVGVRLVDGGMTLHAGLFALLLAPEAFAPLRALGAAHHASEDAAEAVGAAREVLALPVPATAVSHGSALAVTDLTVRFADRSTAAAQDVSFTVAPGETVALRGPSGCGKSTVLAVLAGALRDGDRASVTGSVTLPGEVALVPQFPRTTAVTVADELARHGAGPAELAEVGAAHLLDRECASLSPGELARVALARALGRVRLGARVLLLDEPTASLDIDAVALVADVLASLPGVATVLVTHEPALAALADEVVTLPGASAAVAHPAESTVFPTTAIPVAAAPVAVSATTTVTTPTGSSTWPRRALVLATAAGIASAAAAIGLTAISGWLIVRAAEQPPMLTLMVAIVGVRACGLLRAGLRWGERLAGHDAALGLAARTRTQVWSALAAQGPAADRTPGRALAHVVGDVAVLQDLSVRVLTPPLTAAAVLLGTVAVLTAFDPAVGLAVAAVFVTAVVVVVGVHRLADRGVARSADELRTVTLRETAIALDGAADLRAHGLVPATVERLAALGRRQGRAARRAGTASAVGTAVAVLATGTASLCALAMHAPTLAGPVVAVLALAPLALLEPLTTLNGSLRHRAAWHDARARIDAVLAEPTPAEPASPVALPRPVRAMDVAGVSAGWPGGPDVLRSVDLHAAPGGWAVVTGPSGSGKSTLLSVLMASLRPRSGQVQLGGVDAARVTGADVRDAIAWCPQDAHVFAASLRANLALAAPHADEAAMTAALARVGLEPLLLTLPAGLDTQVGTGGSALSGGERRRLAVARALLADRDVVLLDEPTAHLDPPTAAALVADLRRGLADRVVVCVTHDPGLARPGDAVLDLGARIPVPA